MARALTFRDHILKSVYHDAFREVPVGKGGVECVLILARNDYDRALLCECRDGYADVSVLGSGITPAVECNDTDSVGRMWDRGTGETVDCRDCEGVGRETINEGTDDDPIYSHSNLKCRTCSGSGKVPR